MKLVAADGGRCLLLEGVEVCTAHMIHENPPT